jgi:hypothetical protein
MSKEVNLKSIKFKPLWDKFFKRFRKHAIFASILLVLFVYLFLVFKINSLAQADPKPGQTPANPLAIPKVDKQVINHIQSLEQNNTQLRSLFEQARNNPFQE